LEKLPSRGFGVISADDSGVAELGGVFGKPLVTFGINNPADCMAEDIHHNDFTSSFDMIWRGRKLGTITLRAPGGYNVQNAIAAAAVAMELGIDYRYVKSGLEEYRGISRRFEVHKNNGFMVVDDYAHHPTEVKATLSAARASTDRRIIAVFQPHRYTRTHFLHEEYGKAFDDADIVVVTDIYSAGETPIENVCSGLVVDSILRNSGVRVEEVGDLDKAITWLKSEVRPGDIIITLGAGDVTRVAEALASDTELWPEAQEVLYHVQTG
jgi:UDP-N-acetylmuramate--alanine ligase